MVVPLLFLYEGRSIFIAEPGNPSFKKSTTADSNGRWSFKDLLEGDYIVKADPITMAYRDRKNRTYTYMVNKLNPNEEKQATVVITGQNPNGSSTPAGVELTLEPDENGVYPSGCPAP